MRKVLHERAIAVPDIGINPGHAKTFCRFFASRYVNGRGKYG